MGPRTAAKVQVAATPTFAGGAATPRVDQPPVTARADQFAGAVGEALWELQQVLDEPGVFGDCSVADAARSLGSEFVGTNRDEEIERRLEELVEAEAEGALRLAARHLGHIRRKLSAQGIGPRPSRPLDPSAASEYPARKGRK